MEKGAVSTLKNVFEKCCPLGELRFHRARERKTAFSEELKSVCVCV